MRTTFKLDPDVARLLEEEAQRQRKPFRAVVNEAIRRGLSAAPKTSQRPFRVRPHRTTFRPAIDASSLNRLVDELEDEAVVIKLRAGR